MLRKGQQRLLCTEQNQHRAVKKDHRKPADHSKKESTSGRNRKIGVFILLIFLLAPAGQAEKHRTANACEQPQAVNNVPHRGNHGQSRRTARPLVLPDHGHVDNPVNGADQRTAKRRGQVLKIQIFDLSLQKIHLEPTSVLQLENKKAG